MTTLENGNMKKKRKTKHSNNEKWKNGEWESGTMTKMKSENFQKKKKKRES